MANTIVDLREPVTGGVGTHLDLNVAAAVDGLGGVLGVAEFPTTSAGHKQLLAWLLRQGRLAKVGIEGTSSYGTESRGRCAAKASKSSRWTGPTASPAGVRASPAPPTP